MFFSTYFYLCHPYLLSLFCLSFIGIYYLIFYMPDKNLTYNSGVVITNPVYQSTTKIKNVVVPHIVGFLVFT